MQPNNNASIIPVAHATYHPEGESTMALDYFILSFTGPEGEALYGLRVDKSSLSGTLVEREETEAVTGSFKEITAIAEAFAAGTVPPCVLHEMVYEWFDELELSNIPIKITNAS